MNGKIIIILCVFFAGLSISAKSQCGVLIGFTPSEASSTSIVFNWDAMTGATLYQVQYKIDGGTWNSPTSTTNSYTATGLTGGVYTYRGRALCEGRWQTFTPLTNFTLGDGSSDDGSDDGSDVTCALPTNVTTTEVSSSSITFNWDDMNATRYLLQYIIDGGTYKSVLPTTNSYTATDLAQGEYSYRIRAQCSSGWTGFASSTFILGGNGDTGGGDTGGSSSLWSDNTSHIYYDGDVLIGSSTTATPAGYNLYVKEGILAEKVKVALSSTSAWSDYVFADEYTLNSIEEVEQFVKRNKHLPHVPSAAEVKAEGIDVATMDATLLRQIEELWLHMIEMKKENELLKKQIELLNSN